jgi:hypothetical protein
MIAEMRTWNERLAYAVDQRKETQANLARATGAKPPSVKEWLDGITKNIGAENAAKACSFLRINIDWLLFGKPPSGLEENASAHVWLTGDELSCLKMFNEMEEDARKHWISIGASLPKAQKEKIPTPKVVDEPQAKTIQSKPRRLGDAGKHRENTHSPNKEIERRKQEIQVIHERRKRPWDYGKQGDE